MKAQHIINRMWSFGKIMLSDYSMSYQRDGDDWYGISADATGDKNSVKSVRAMVMAQENNVRVWWPRKDAI